MVLIFDMGGTRTRIAVVSDGVMGDVVRMGTDRSAKGFAKFLGALEELAAGRKVEMVVGSMPGHLEGKEGHLSLALNLPEWADLPVLLRLENLFECPVHVANDVVMGGLGESHDGAGIIKGVMAYFTVSTGINGVRLVDGEVDASINPYQLGQQLVGEVDGEPVMLETLVGGAAFEARLGKAPKEMRDAELWKTEARYLARGIYNTILHWTPDLILFGGSMMRDIDLKLVTEELERFPVFTKLPRLGTASLGDMAGLHGALAWLKQIEDSQ